MEYPEGESCPTGRQYHAAVCLGQGTRPQLVVFWGRDDNHVLNDALWILDVESGRWKEVSLRIDKFGIANHTCTYTWGSGSVPCIIRHSCGLLYFNTVPCMHVDQAS